MSAARGESGIDAARLRDAIRGATLPAVSGALQMADGFRRLPVALRMADRSE